MNHETIDRVELLNTGELILGLVGKGNTTYQYVYREAAGVYWDEKYLGFKSTPLREWTCSDWYNHIVTIVRSGLGVELSLAGKVDWVNIPSSEIEKIKSQC